MKNMKKLMLCMLMTSFGVLAFGQKYFTKEGDISFYSEAPTEKIEAKNKRAAVVLDAETGAIEIALLIKSFQFEKALMQEHFNENYMESDKFPKATFKGKVEDDVDFMKDGSFITKVKGELTIHGVTKPIEADAKFNVQNGMIHGASSFIVACADYDIKIPSVVADNIAKEIEISIAVELKPLDK